MASLASFLLLSLIFSNFLSTFAADNGGSMSASFRLTSVRTAARGSSGGKMFQSSLRGLAHRKGMIRGTKPKSSFNYSSTFKYTMALIVTLPIGTPAQKMRMVLDTASQLSWILCNKTGSQAPKPKPARTHAIPSFDPSQSTSFSDLPCSHPVCKPRVPDFSFPTSCQNNLCHYSYFFADGTVAEGNLVEEKFPLAKSQPTDHHVLGCAENSNDNTGILGMNLGRLSFPSQAKIQTFSYCVPLRTRGRRNPDGAFYLGQNPNSSTFKYTNLLSFSEDQRRTPNLDSLAYTVNLTAIRIHGKRLNISESVFRADDTGSGQTILDSGTEYTFLVDEAYEKVRAEVAKLAGARLKKEFVYQGAMDMCFNGNATEIGRLIGDMAFEFDNGVEILISSDRVADDVGRGVSCVGIGRSQRLDVSSNIIGNFHQQNLWVEFDLTKRRVGIGATVCSRAL